MSRQTVWSVAPTITVGLDLGDRFSRYSEMDFETGVIAEGRLRADGVFVASDVLAKHDETYMPREVADALKESGEWRGEEAGQ